MILSLVLFTQLAASCGPTVHVDTLAAVASTESQFNTLAIGDNTGGRSYAPATLQEAIVTATALLQQGHSLDLGLMQINSANLRGLGLSVADTFDPCKSIAGGTRVLVEGYRPAPGEDTQAALLRALSHYNTGSQGRGFANGYVTRVQASAEQIVPAIRLGGTAGVNCRSSRTTAPAILGRVWASSLLARARWHDLWRVEASSCAGSGTTSNAATRRAGPATGEYQCCWRCSLRATVAAQSIRRGAGTPPRQ